MEELRWRKASRSNSNGSCVEIAAQPGVRYVRDSKVPDGKSLRFTAADFSALLDDIRADRLGE